jgi:hypothetical protein
MGRKRLRNLLFAAVALGFLTMPVEYRAGAAIAHPHALYQFWIEAAHGTMDHHVHGAAHSHAAPAPAGSADDPAGDEPTASGLMQPGAGLFALTTVFVVLLIMQGSLFAPVRWRMPIKTGRCPAPAVPPP